MNPITEPEEIVKTFNEYEWEQAACYATWNPEDVTEIIATDEGVNDGANWLMVVKLKDGRFSFLSAGCDYTGWDCQANGSSQEYATLDQLIRMGLGKEDRERLDLSLPA